MTKILIVVVAIASLTPVAKDTATTQGFCDVLPWMPFCTALR